MLASVGAAAKRGLLIKGGKYLEALARADVVLLDKTGTLTLGRPHITDVWPLHGMSEDELIVLAASADHYSEHPLAEAVRMLARERGLMRRSTGDASRRFLAWECERVSTGTRFWWEISDWSLPQNCHLVQVRDGSGKRKARPCSMSYEMTPW